MYYYYRDTLWSQTDEYPKTELVSIDFVEADEECSIPMIKITYIPVLTFYCMTEEEITEWTKKGFTPEKEEDGSYHLYLVSKDEAVIHICNFRRYGWCVSPENSGKHGYNGPVYANGDLAYELCYSPEDVLKLSLQKMITGLEMNDGNFKSIYREGNKNGLRSAFRKLLDDAIAYAIDNPTRYSW